ncbi:hypothetical protein J6590_105455 [Homalodisca vitripennis]|nr:hypothetical protein J6590_105455 [Homalodisca vitripennis]
MTYPVSPRGGQQTLATGRPANIETIYLHIYRKLFTSTRSFVLAGPLAYCRINQNGEFSSGSFVLAGPLAYCLVNHDGEFCLGRPPSLLPVSITTGSFVWAGPLAYCQFQSRRGVLFGQAP